MKKEEGKAFDSLEDLSNFLGGKIKEMESLFGLPSSSPEKKTDGNIIHVDFKRDK